MSSPASEALPTTLFVGIDLGSAHTRIVASNGKQRSTRPCASYPEHRFSPKQRRGPAQTVEAILKDLVVSVSSGERMIRGVVCVSTLADRDEKRAIVMSARLALDAVMVASQPLAAAFGHGPKGEALLVDIGAASIDLCRLVGRPPQRQDLLSIPQAGNHIDRVLVDSILKRHPGAQFTVEMAAALKEELGHDGRDIEVECTVGGEPKTLDVTSDLKLACRSILRGLLDGIRRLIGELDREQQARLRHNIILCGGVGQMRGLRALVEEGLQELGGGAATIADDPTFAVANGALRMAQEMPIEHWRQLSAVISSSDG